MRWDGLISGLQSLWESEADNAELDERRELLRAERAQTPFVRVLAQRASREPIVVTACGTGHTVHVSVVGASWVEGVSCGIGEHTIIPHGSIQWIRPANDCGCRVQSARVFEHATIGAKLREIERRGVIVTAITAHGGVRGRICAVWKDAIDVVAGDVTHTVVLESLVALSVDGS